jgi:hypothetical protein
MEKVKYRGFTINIEQDDCPMNPRREWDNLGTMICEHNSYDLGDECDFKPWNANNWQEHMAEYFQEKYDVLSEFGDYDTYEKDVKKIWKWIDANVVWLPLYLYDHSGITMSCGPFSCSWDSGQVGFIYITKEKALSEYGGKIFSKKLKERVASYLKGEVETYDQYLRGNVYGFFIEESGDSCQGYFGYDHEKSGLLECAKAEIDAAIKHQLKARFQKLKSLILSKVPLAYRQLPEIYLDSFGRNNNTLSMR